MTFIYHLLNGVHVGSIYALVALGYSMVYGIVKLINFAHGDIIMVGAYIAWLIISSMGLPVWAGIISAIIFCMLLGMAIEKVAYKPLRNSARISLLITAIGISLLLENLAQMIFSSTPKTFPNFLEGGIMLGDRKISMTTIVTIIVSILLMVALTALVNRTKMGKAMRAVSEDTDAARLMGINVDRTISFTFAIGSGLAAVAALLYCCAYPQVSSTMGSLLGLKAFVAAVLGGIGSIPGAMIGGILIGVAESLTKALGWSQITDAVVFGILILVLLVKPAGLLGRNIKEKV